MVVGVYRNAKVKAAYFNVVINDTVEIATKHLKPAALVYTNDLALALKAINGDPDSPEVELIENGRDITVGDVLKLDKRFWLIGVEGFLPMQEVPWARTLMSLTVLEHFLEEDLDIGERFEIDENQWQVIEIISDGTPFTVKAFQVNAQDIYKVPPQFLRTNIKYMLIVIILIFGAFFSLIYLTTGSGYQPSTTEPNFNQLLIDRALTEESDND